MDEIAEQSINICISEFEKEENQKKIKQHILNPIIRYLGKQIWPYVLISTILLLFFIISLIIILYYILKYNNLREITNRLTTHTM